jgi:hypothetical protein
MSEVALASNEASVQAHRELYHFTDDAYIITQGDLLGSITGLLGDINKIHVALTWTDIMKLAVWKSEPDMKDAFLVLRNIGIPSDELFPFRDSAVADLFPWLYYGKRFDLLRKICLSAKKNIEKNISIQDVRADCHLVSEETSRIVASSL